MPSHRQRLFAACAPGLEPLLAEELQDLGLDARALEGGAEAEGDDALAVACLGSRLADAVALRLFDGPAGDLDEALAEARHRHGRSAALAVRREGGRATVSLDAAGAPLFRRGWRARVGAAPLRESIAAGLLRAAGYTGEEPLLDPMCGSGTLPLEAYGIASRRPPGLGRHFAFERWPDHDAARTAAVRLRLAAAERPAPAPIRGSDRNAGVLRLAGKNLASAGLPEGAVLLGRADAAALAPPSAAGLLAVNPPYGVRLDADARTAWEALASLLARAPGWRAAVLGPPGFLSLLGRRPISTISVRNGGIACQLSLLGRAPGAAAPSPTEQAPSRAKR